MSDTAENFPGRSLEPLTALTLLLIEAWQVFSCCRSPPAHMDVARDERATMILVAALMHRPRCSGGARKHAPAHTTWMLD